MSDKLNNDKIQETPVPAQEVHWQNVNNVNVETNNDTNAQNDFQQQYILFSQACTQPSAQITNLSQADNQTLQFAPWQSSATSSHISTNNRGVPTSQLSPNPIQFIGISNLSRLVQTIQQPLDVTPLELHSYDDNMNSKRAHSFTNILPSETRRIVTLGKVRNMCKQRMMKSQGRGRPAVHAPAKTQEQLVKEQMLVVNFGGQLVAMPESMVSEVNQQLNIQQQCRDQLLQQEAVLRQQQKMVQQQLALNHQRQNQNQHLMQKTGYPVTSMNQGMLNRTTQQRITSVQQPISPLTQNIVQDRTPKMVHPDQLIQSSVEFAQSNPPTGIVQQSGSSLNRNFHQQINLTVPSPVQSPQSFLEYSQNPNMQLPDTILSTQNFMSSSPQRMLFPPQNPLHVAGQQMQQSLFITPDTVGQSIPAIQQPVQSTVLQYLLQQPPRQYQPISQFQLQQTQHCLSPKQQQQSVNAELQQIVQPGQTQHVSNQILPSVTTMSSDSSTNTTLVTGQITEPQKDTMVTPSHVQEDSLITTFQQTQLPHIIVSKGSSESLQPSTSASTKEMSTTVPTTTPLQTQDVTVINTIQNESLSQAKVKPIVLTHVIDGIVIQEADLPFPVSGSFRSSFPETQEQENERNDNSTNERILERQRSFESDKVPSCLCQGFPSIWKECVHCDDIILEIHSTSSSNISSKDALSPEPLSSSSLPRTSSISGRISPEENVCEEPHTNNFDQASHNQPSSDILQWGISEVYDFVKSVIGCATYAYDFVIQEVDGEALLLIKPEHLVMAMGMKLGPALRIVSSIDTLRHNNVFLKDAESSNDINQNMSVDNFSLSQKINPDINNM